MQCSCRYDVLEEEECGAVEQLVFCDQRQTAHATGEFLALRIIRLSIEASPKKMKQGIDFRLRYSGLWK